MRSDIDVQQKVLKAVAGVVNRREDEIDLSASLQNDLKMDSLNLMTLFIVLEDEFHQTIPLEEVAGVDTVQGIVDFISRKMNQTSAA